MNARGYQQYGDTFILRFASLKMVVLLHETALANFPMATTVCTYSLCLYISLLHTHTVLKFASVKFINVKNWFANVATM